MTQPPKRRRLGQPFDLPPRWEWIVWLVMALGGSGIAIAVLWLGQDDVVGTVCAPLAALVGMAVLLGWLNHLAFKAAEPRPGDSSGPPIEDNSRIKRN